MFGRDSRQPIDLLLGTGEQEVEPTRKGKNDVYVIEPADGFGELRTVNRVDLRLCPQPETTTRRKLPCLPDEKTIDPDRHEELSDDERLQWRCIIRSSLPQPLERVSSSDDSGDSPINDGCDVTTDTSESRTTAGWHSNRFREPRSALNGH
ncbi:hypothetical protein LSAT2_002824 [Lamellibrachia satsuma]|nr:hypothetical protein LSAT2_002824 [Lamellibrachia satsuma]